jgi:hypothetical protein
MSVGEVFDGGSESLGIVVEKLSLGRCILCCFWVGCEFKC